VANYNLLAKLKEDESLRLKPAWYGHKASFPNATLAFVARMAKQRRRSANTHPSKRGRIRG
jgi:hypothetical protein